MHTIEVAVIGAGPSGAVAAALLRKLGHQVTVIERSHFPRFSIGESLLPQCMEFIEAAGMAEAVAAEQFQHKDGAVFVRNGAKSTFAFTDKFSPGPGTTYQVPRARFDKVLADAAQSAGADIRYGSAITDIELTNDGGVVLTVEPAGADAYRLNARFVLDASGFGRVLPRLLQLDTPSSLPPRMSIFTHIRDNISAPDYDRDKIIIAVHPLHTDIWYWVIPFADGLCSIGVVGEQAKLTAQGDNLEQQLWTAVNACPELEALLANAEPAAPVRSITGYACNVSALSGPGYALLGNAGEFLDPIFSSGVTIAMKSAVLAAPLVSRQLRGEAVNWQTEFAQPLHVGVNTFRAYVQSWYEGGLQDVIFSERQNPTVRAMICSILAGYAWDQNNPYVQEPQRRLNVLAEICRTQ